ncbi:hypothetical protein BN844_1544 [Pseudomonas sp. SHC52]|nr:hypothetical protein BN844_1544 [Pseudomonas sp. SHC52]
MSGLNGSGTHEKTRQNSNKATAHETSGQKKNMKSPRGNPG